MEIIYNLFIREEKAEEYRTIEEMVRKGFWNMYKKGADEHYIAHRLRESEDHIPELTSVLLMDAVPVGYIQYSKGRIMFEDGTSREAVSFGPVVVEPHLQGKGLGSHLIEHTLEMAESQGVEAVFITGDPDYYTRFGFEPARSHGIVLKGTEDQENTDFFMVKIMKGGFLDGAKGTYSFSPCYDVSPEETEKFDIDHGYTDDPLES